MRRDPMRTVLRLRRLHEQQARAAVGRAAGEVTRAEARVAEALRAVRSHRVMAGDVASLLRSRTQLVALRVGLEEAEQQREDALAAHRAAIDEWHVRRAEERAVERLLERRAEQERLERLTAEQLELDEAALLVRASGRQRQEVAT